MIISPSLLSSIRKLHIILPKDLFLGDPPQKRPKTNTTVPRKPLGAPGSSPVSSIMRTGKLLQVLNGSGTVIRSPVTRCGPRQILRLKLLKSRSSLSPKVSLERRKFVGMKGLLSWFPEALKTKARCGFPPSCTIQAENQHLRRKPILLPNKATKHRRPGSWVPPSASCGRCSTPTHRRASAISCAQRQRNLLHPNESPKRRAS